MSYFKNNSSVIIRLMITHIGMSVFGLVIFLATNMQGDDIMLAASILSLIFYAAIVYVTMWEYGAKDKPAIDAGRMSFAPGNAFTASLCAEALGIILIATYLVSSYFIETSEVAAQVYAICYMVLYLVESCASGFMLYFHHLYENALINSLCFLISPVLISIASVIGYTFGVKGIRIIPEKKKQ